MAEQTTATGVLGGLPPLPRKPLNSSVIAAEQAYRKRKGLPMPWEPGGTMPDPAAVAAELGTTAATAPAQPAAAGTAATGGAPVVTQAAAAMSNVQGGLPNLPRKQLNNSVISAEQAYRKKKGLALLNDAEIYCLKQGLPMPWEPGGTMPDPAAVAAAAGAAPAAPATPATAAAAA